MWKEQYERMLRGFRKIEEFYYTTYSRNDFYGQEIFEGRGSYPDIHDTVVHFFQDCFHLRDWIKNASPLSKNDKDDIYNAFLRSSTFVGLPICRDVANASKHLVLDKTFSVDRNMMISSTGTAHVAQSDVDFSLRFNIEMPNSNNVIDVLELAHSCVNEWDKILKNKRLFIAIL